MAKRRQKKRTHVRISEEELEKIPRSMVIHLNDTLKNHAITQLVRDFRNMMQPHTAINLRERRSNKLKDFIVMAGPLGVSQLFLFSQNEKTGSTNLRMSSMPRGPTLTFNIVEYSLGKDISRVLRNPKSVSRISSEFVNPPLLVMNGFTNPKDADPHEKLIITMFQNMFPPINPQVTKVNTIKRVLLLNKDSETGIIDLRHYIIDTKLVDVSKSVKRLINIRKNFNKKLPNLSKVKDVADIVLDPYSNGAAGFTSDSEIEEDAIVEVEDDNEVLTRPKVRKETDSKEDSTTAAAPADTKRKRAVKLTEIGPRLKLNLVKIEEGVCAGRVMYHSQITKTEKEKNQLDQRHAVRKKEKLMRQKEQEANIAKKKEKKLAKKQRREENKARRENGEAVEDDESSDDEDDDDKDSSDEEDPEEQMVEAGINSDGDLFDVDDYEME